MVPDRFVEVSTQGCRGGKVRHIYDAVVRRKVLPVAGPRKHRHRASDERQIELFINVVLVVAVVESEGEVVLSVQRDQRRTVFCLPWREVLPNRDDIIIRGVKDRLENRLGGCGKAG